MKKGLLITLLILLLIYSVGGIAFYFLKDAPSEEVKNISEIPEYGYILKSNATAAMKEEFQNLKEILSGDDINEEEYAKSVAKLFIIDLYTLNNKLNKYNVGGDNYVFPDAVEHFRLNVMDTLYKYIEDNSDEKREQKLPEVKSASVTEIEETTFEYDKEEYSGYKIKLTWDYMTSEDYDKEGEVILIKKDNKYYIAEKN